MRILLSNDDGFQAAGLRILRAAVAEFGQTVVVAPVENCSGFSNALSLHKPIQVKNHGDNIYAVYGTPADCVHLAVNGMLDFEPDLVISGINYGANLGDDTIYSGTVAAALEGRFLRLPSLAISLAGDQPSCFDTAATVVTDILRRLTSHHIPDNYLLNVNVPDMPYSQLSGYEITRCGKRNHSEPVLIDEWENGSGRFRIGGVGIAGDAGPGTDFYAISHGRVSITPLTNDMTHHGNLNLIGNWMPADWKNIQSAINC